MFEDEYLGSIALLWLMALILGAVVFGPWSAWLATRKGRMLEEGFFLGVVFGPLGVLIEWRLPDGPRPRGLFPPPSPRPAVPPRQSRSTIPPRSSRIGAPLRAPTGAPATDDRPPSDGPEIAYLD